MKIYILFFNPSIVIFHLFPYLFIDELEESRTDVELEVKGESILPPPPPPVEPIIVPPEVNAVLFICTRTN